MKKFFIGCVAMMSLVACNKEEKSSETQASDVATQDVVVEVTDDATVVAADATEAVDAGSAVSTTEEVSATK